jgi:hypothetical protein
MNENDEKRCVAKVLSLCKKKLMKGMGIRDGARRGEASPQVLCASSDSEKWSNACA